MSFKIKDKDVHLKYSEIRNRIKKLLGVKFSSSPIYNEEYIKTKAKMFNGANNTSFTEDEIPKEKNHYVCIAAVDIDYVLKIEKNVYLQVYLEQCKHKLKKRKPVHFIEDEVDDDSDYEIDSYWSSNLLFEKGSKH